MSVTSWLRRVPGWRYRLPAKEVNEYPRYQTLGFW
jgi:hypothetical protein